MHIILSPLLTQQRKQCYAVRHVHRAFCRMASIRRRRRSIQLDRHWRQHRRKRPRPWNCNRWSNAKPNWTNCCMRKIICCNNCVAMRRNYWAVIHRRMVRRWKRSMVVWIRCVAKWTPVSNCQKICWTMAERTMCTNCYWPSKYNSKFQRRRSKWPMIRCRQRYICL